MKIDTNNFFSPVKETNKCTYFSFQSHSNLNLTSRLPSKWIVKQVDISMVDINTSASTQSFEKMLTCIHRHIYTERKRHGQKIGGQVDRHLDQTDSLPNRQTDRNTRRQINTHTVKRERQTNIL